MRYHSIDEPFELRGHGIGGEDRGFDLLAFSWSGGSRGHEAVCAAVVDCAAGEVGAPFLGG